MSSQQLKLSPLSKIPWEPAGQGHRWAYSSVKLQGPLQGSEPEHSWRGQGQCHAECSVGAGPGGGCAQASAQAESVGKAGTAPGSSRVQMPESGQRAGCEQILRSEGPRLPGQQLQRLELEDTP